MSIVEAKHEPDMYKKLYDSLQARYNIAHNCLSTAERKSMELPVDASSDIDTGYVSEMDIILNALQMASGIDEQRRQLVDQNLFLRTSIRSLRDMLNTTVDGLTLIDGVD